MGELCHTTGLTWEVSWKKKEKWINKGAEKVAQRDGRHKSLWTRVVEDKEIEKVRQREGKKEIERDKKKESEKEPRGGQGLPFKREHSECIRRCSQ